MKNVSYKNYGAIMNPAISVLSPKNYCSYYMVFGQLLRKCVKCVLT